MTRLIRSEPSGFVTTDDCCLLASVFEEEVTRLFPVPVSVRLYTGTDKEEGSLSSTAPAVPKNFQEAVSKCMDKSGPLVHSGILCIPLKLVDGRNAVFVLGAADSSLLQKFSSSWLRDFQKSVYHHVQLVRQVYIDPETSLYNRRALELFIRSVPEAGEQSSLYLFSTSFMRRTTAGAFRKIQYLAGFFSAISPGRLFFLGQGVFALVVAGKDRRTRLTLAHTLQRRLKREGLQKVRVAFCDCSQQGNDRIYDEVLKALAIAERRGPFGFCDTDSLKNSDRLPFALPGDNGMKMLRKLWRGVDQFGLALFQRDRDSQSAQPLEPLLLSLLSGKEHCLAFSPEKVLVFLPGGSAAAAESRVRDLAEAVQDGQLSVTVGACFFPCLNYSKTAMVKNCRKAVMHAEFYGPGSLVIFNYLSLNVSGDWYFDEGDFRQAVTEYTQGLSLYPGESNLLNSLGVAQIEMNRNRQAIASFTEVLEKDSDNYMALVNLGYAYQMLGRDTLALEYFEKAFTVQYHSGISGTDIYQQLSRLYCRAGRYDKALPVLRLWQQKKEREKDFLLYRLLGEAYSETGRLIDAMKALQQALQIYPHDMISMSMLGLLYVEQGEGEEAGLLLLEKAISIDETCADCRYRLARALLYLGRMREALDEVGTCLQLKRGHIQGMLLRGKILSASGKTKQAAAVYRRVLSRKNSSNAERRMAEKAIVALEDAGRNTDSRYMDE